MSIPLGITAGGSKKRSRDEPEDDGAFDSKHYYANPSEYEPIFHEAVLPYTSILVNCMYWDAGFPRLVTIDQARELRQDGRLPLLGVCDITCDLRGSVEFLTVRPPPSGIGWASCLSFFV